MQLTKMAESVGSNRDSWSVVVRIRFIEEFGRLNSRAWLKRNFVMSDDEGPRKGKGKGKSKGKGGGGGGGGGKSGKSGGKASGGALFLIFSSFLLLCGMKLCCRMI